jgi:steroid 5-alpha reductase family enzyme
MTVKAGMSEFMWQLFNIVFVAFAQNVLLFIVTTPAYILLLATKKGMPMETVDLYIPRAIILLIFTEIIADQQQWSKSLFRAASLKYADKFHRLPKGEVSI